MMEVKQNTSVDLNDLMTSRKSNGADEVDDAIMTDLTNRAADRLVTCDLLKESDETTNITELENGDAAIISIIKDVDNVGEDLNSTVNSELEDALLAEDDVLPGITSSKKIERSLSATEDILADKADTSNSTTSSNNVRDPGDDLDTLLSKINDIVEDCIESEIKNGDSKNVEPDQEVNKNVENHEGINLKETNLALDETNVLEDKNLEEETSIQPTEDKQVVLTEETENLINKEESPTSLDLPNATTELLNSVDGDVENNKKKLCSERVTPEPTTKANINIIVSQSNRVDNITENNLNIEKTEEYKAEIVQDNKISSNRKDIFEHAQTQHLTTVDSAEASLPIDSVEKNEEVLNKEKEAVVAKMSTLADEKPISEQTVASGNDESDDEIVFYVDQPPEMEKPQEMDANSSDTVKKKDELSMQNKEIPSPEKKKPQDDEDIVLLLDDDDEEVSQVEKEKLNRAEIATNDLNEGSEPANISVEGNSETKEKSIVIDNSDNAQDEFSLENTNEKEKVVNKNEVSQTTEETNSNCSSSSNLLQESKPIKLVADEVTPEDAENEEDEDDGEVELIIGEGKDTENSEKVEDTEIVPPAKRLRLSEDGELHLGKPESCDRADVAKMSDVVEKKQETSDNVETDISLETHANLKRSHDVIETESNEKSDESKEGINKKLKTDDLKTDVIVSDKLDEIKDDRDSEDVKFLEDDKKNIKAVPSYEPIRLYPAPEFGALKSHLPMSLDFLKKFRKSFDNMTKQDLEELVLQKVVEAIIHRSEFSEMRELIDKQEKLISAHRTKISELSKQFRDLEMVHNRVVKDIEQRNSQFIMPVKITRAVGLQVYIPNKKSLAEPNSSPPGLNISSSPQRPIPPQTSSTSNSNLTTVQRQYLSSQTDTQQQRPAATISSGTGNTTPNIRRGCVQKITPIRPVPGATQTSSVGPTPVATPYRNTSNHSSTTQPRILNKNAAITANSTAIQRPRYLSSNQDSQRMSTQQLASRTTNMPSNSQRVAANTATQSKATSNAATTVPRRSEPLASSTSNSSTSSIVDNYINTLTHLTGGNTAVSITPAKPKEKAVIDLTDEDETPLSSGPQTTQVPRRIMPSQSSNSQLQYGRAAPPLTRVPPANQMVNNKNRQMSSLQAQKSNSFTSITTPPGTSITRINVASNPSNVQRVKYSHPAPLPATPAQAFNPSWKLPPPRPTIRISNLDNGIVISWTMEESMDRHAECVSYQIYAYQETSGPPMVDSWRHVGDVKAMLLPMAVTLTQFQEGQRYYFAVRAVDCHQRYGPFSLPKTWS